MSITKSVSVVIALAFVALSLGQTKDKADPNPPATKDFDAAQSATYAQLIAISDAIAQLELRGVEKVRSDVLRQPMPKDAAGRKRRTDTIRACDDAIKNLKRNPRRISPIHDRQGSVGTIGTSFKCGDIVSPNLVRATLPRCSVEEAFLETSTDGMTSDNSYSVSGIWVYADTRSYSTVLGATRTLAVLKRVDDRVVRAFEKARPVEYEIPDSISANVHRAIEGFSEEDRTKKP